MTKELPVSTGAKLLDINRINVYYGGTSVSQEELESKALIDRLHTDNPAWSIDTGTLTSSVKTISVRVWMEKAGELTTS